MEEILFRGKRESDGKWVEGGFTLDAIGKPRITTVTEDRQGLIFHKVIKKTVAQHVGLSDKNGKKVFKDSILRSVHFIHKGKPAYLYHVVQWSDRFAGWIAKSVENIGKEYSRGDVELWIYCRSTEFEDVGNIHDNPELLIP